MSWLLAKGCYTAAEEDVEREKVFGGIQIRATDKELVGLISSKGSPHILSMKAHRIER